jgi:hypothetical protein
MLGAGAQAKMAQNAGHSGQSHLQVEEGTEDEAEDVQRGQDLPQAIIHPSWLEHAKPVAQQ